MVDKIEMSLDEIIKSTRGQKKAGAGTGRGLRGATQRGGRRTVVGGAPRKPGGGAVLKGRSRGGGIQKAKFARGDVNSAWKHDMYDGPKRGNLLKSDLAKLLVSNLDYGVSDSDIQELFAEFGPLKKAAVHYDRSGRSLGTADVVFERRSDAIKAIKQYNGVPLDGRPMNIQLATSDVTVLTRSARPIGGAPAVMAKRRQGGNSPAKRGGPGGRRIPPNRRKGPVVSGRRGKGPAKTAEELDAELDAYVNDMKI